MLKSLKYSIVAATIFLASCTTIEGPKYSEIPQTIESGKSRIVVYRQWSATGAVWPSHFYVNGKLFAELNNSGFSYIDVSPGKYQVSSGPEKNPTFNSVEIVTEESKVYFVRLFRGMPDIFGVIPPNEATKSLTNGKYNYQVLSH